MQAETELAKGADARFAATESFHTSCGDALKRLGVVAAAKAEANTTGRSTLTVVGTLHEAEVEKMASHLSAARDAAAATVAASTAKQSTLVTEISTLKDNEATTVESEVAEMYSNVDAVVVSINSTRVNRFRLPPHMWITRCGHPSFHTIFISTSSREAILGTRSHTRIVVVCNVINSLPRHRGL